MTSIISITSTSDKRDSIITVNEDVISTSSPEHLFNLPSISYYNSHSPSSSSNNTPSSSRSNSQDPFFKKKSQLVSTSPQFSIFKIFSSVSTLFSKNNFSVRDEAKEDEVSDRITRWSRNSSITIVEDISTSTTEKLSFELITETLSSSSKFELAIIFFLIFIVGFTNESATGASLASMQQYYSKSYEMISLVFLLNIAGYITSCLLSPFLSQRVGLQKSLVVAGICQSLGSLILAQAPIFPIFVASMFLLGLGSGLFDSLLTTAISHHSDKRPALMDWLYSAFAFGAVFPPIIIGSLIDHGYNWNIFYWIPFTLTSVASLITYPVFSHHTEPVDEVLDLPTSTSSIAIEGTFSRMKRALHLRIVWLGFVLIFIAFATSDTLSAWIVSFSISRNAETLIKSRYLLSSFWFGATLGRIFLTMLGKKVGEKTFSISLLLSSAVGLSLLWTVKEFYANGVATMFAGFFLGPVTPRTLTAISSRVPTSLKGAVISFTVAIGLVGASLGPLLFGIIANNGGLNTLPAILMSFCLLAAVAWLAVPSKVNENSL